MAHLSIHLLGTFRVELDGIAVSGFRTNKTRALLAYLAVESRRVHQRAQIAGLLWPGWPESQARTYLRQALANLQNILCSETKPPSFFLTSRHSLQFDPTRDIWLDANFVSDALSNTLAPDKQRSNPLDIIQLQEAIDIYQGSFLEGFFLDGCAAFEEWQLLTQERLRRQVVDALDVLVQWHEERNETALAQRYAWKRIELEPFIEEGQRQLMRLLAQGGESNAALAHYDQYSRLLEEELGSSPAAATATLVEQIKAGQAVVDPLTQGIESRVPPSGPGDDLLPLPPFLSAIPALPRAAPVFVDRTPELAQLAEHLDTALAGRGHVLFVVGDAGMGKTVLLQEFARRSQDAHSGLVVASGRCCSHRGVGDPFLPFREILAQLTGDLEALRTAGAVTRNQAQRLWTLLPHVVEGLLAYGPDLIDSFVSGRALATRLAALPGSQSQLADLAQLQHRDLSPRRATTLSQVAIFDQWTRVVHAAAHARPLLLWLDDLQWSDLDSIALLFHLGQRLAGSRVLIVGCYRPVEVALGRDGQRHPLEKVIHEFQQRTGAMNIDLGQSNGRHFVEAFLDTEPNRLSLRFQETLYRLSDGHPLFTVELVRSMQEQGILRRDSEGHWIEGLRLDRGILPTRVEAVVAERVERLPDKLRQVLAAASVQGEHFTAEVIADALACDAGRLTQQLSNVLDRQHRLVVAQGIQRVVGQRLATYRFRHNLFQKYVYERLDAVERSQRHEEVADALTRLYEQASDGVAPIATQLAWHYRQAGVLDKAIAYLVQAGNEAIRLSAYDEAVASFTEGLALLRELPPGSDRQMLELNLLMGLGAMQAMTKGDAGLETEKTWLRANHLCQQVGDSRNQYLVTWRLWHCHFQRGNLRKALELGQECMEIAKRNDNPMLQGEAKTSLAATFLRFGLFRDALDAIAHAQKVYESSETRHPKLHRELDSAVELQAIESQLLWYLGFPDQALASSQAALVQAEETEHAYSQAFALIFAAGLHQRCRDTTPTALFANKTIHLSRKHGFPLWAAVGRLYRGWAIAARGEAKHGLDEAQAGSDAVLATAMDHIRYHCVLIDVYRMAGRIEKALALVKELLDTVQRTDEREWEAELHRLRGDLLLKLDQRQINDEAEGCFLEAIEVAQAQEAKSLELRATVSLCQLWRRQGKVNDSIHQLQEVTTWFTEGFDTPDFKEAQRLLAALSQRS